MGSASLAAADAVRRRPRESVLEPAPRAALRPRSRTAVRWCCASASPVGAPPCNGCTRAGPTDLRPTVGGCSASARAAASGRRTAAGRAGTHARHGTRRRVAPCAGATPCRRPRVPRAAPRRPAARSPAQQPCDRASGAGRASARARLCLASRATCHVADGPDVVGRRVIAHVADVQRVGEHLQQRPLVSPHMHGHAGVRPTKRERALRAQEAVEIRTQDIAALRAGERLAGRRPVAPTVGEPFRATRASRARGC